ncbi:MAG: DUF4976 domain-containing protein [Candidatus Omnitrophica bacterium COP1]|nr:DUF4976 domain-containing protein [Candidatus Omnitrophica bacterium COP1]
MNHSPPGGFLDKNMTALLLGFIFLLNVCLTILPACSQDKPNIIFILTDDQSAWSLGCLGNTQAHTPNLNRLFDGGVTLSNCFVTTPVCSPSRASLFTSRYGSELGITDWISPKTEPHIGLSRSVSTWPKVLQNSGYDTCLVGKWHLGTDRKYHPHHHGFNHFYGFASGGVTVTDPVLCVDDATEECKGFTDDILTDRAIRFLNEKENSRPFLLCLHLRAPHAPWKPFPEDDYKPYSEIDPIIPNPAFPELDIEKVKDITRQYLTSITGIDRNIGRLLKHLDERHLRQNTVIIFTSDNGYNIGHNGIWHKGNGHKITLDVRGLPSSHPTNQRPNMYDTSLLVPAVIDIPGHDKNIKKMDRVVSSLDWYPTILSIAGIPCDSTPLIRGHNFLPLLKGESISWCDDLYGEYGQHHYTRADLKMIRTTEWKYIVDQSGSYGEELYHLTIDPDETANLADDNQYQEIKADLRNRLKKAIEEIDKTRLY